MQVVENFIDEKDLIIIENTLKSNSFPWYYGFAITENNPTTQFTHTFHDRDMLTSNYIDLLKPILKKIPSMIYFRIKANLNPRTQKIEETGEHFDVQDKRLKSAVFFINDCDGYCRVGNEKIYSQKNKLITFDSDTIHTGSSTTNQPCRLVLNFIYLPWEKYVG